MVLVEGPFCEPLLPPLHAARTPPAPVASAPAPTPRSTDRREGPRPGGSPPAPQSGLISSPSHLTSRGVADGLNPAIIVLPECSADAAAERHRHSASWIKACFVHFAPTSSGCDPPIGLIDHTAPLVSGWRDRSPPAPWALGSPARGWPGSSPRPRPQPRRGRASSLRGRS